MRYSKEIRQQKKEPKVLQKKNWNFSAYELQEMADFLDAQIRGINFEYTGGLPFDYVFFGLDGKECFKPKAYKNPTTGDAKLYSRLVRKKEAKYLVNGKPMLDAAGRQLYTDRNIGETEQEIDLFLKAEDIINLVDKWRREAAELRAIEDPNDRRQMPPEFKKRLVTYWCNKPGIDESKYTLKPLKVSEHPEIVEEVTNDKKAKEALKETIRQDRGKVYSSYGGR